jgi:hypothetical protein
MSFPFTVPLSQKDTITDHSTARHPLGTRGQTADGRVYRYAQNGATALVKGKLCQSEAPATAWENATLSYLSTQWPTGTTSVSTTWTYLPLTCTKDSTLTVAKDYFAQGYIWAKGTSTECGQMIKLKGNDVMATATTSLVKAYFDDNAFLSEAIDSGSFVAMQKNPYDDVIVSISTNPTALCVGVPNADVTALYYFWIQTWGVCAVGQDAAAAVAAKPILTSTTVAGKVQGVTGSTDLTGTALLGQWIGVHAGEAQAASEHILVHLTLAP